jgi:hypothetical protein
MLTDELKDIMWQLRQKQNLSELMPLYSELKLKYPDEQEIQCLESSLYRARGEIKKAQGTLRALRSTDATESLNPRVFMEEGLNYLYVGDSYNGLEKFLACYSLIKNNKNERLLAVQSLINAMISLDNLGMSYAYTEEEFNKLKLEMEVPASYIATVEMLRLYDLFRKGDFKAIDEIHALHGGQARFFKYYVGLLPYHSSHYPRHISSEIENLFTQDSELYLKSYRLRTLQKCLHPEDEKNKKVSEVIDRLYLWTWQFMMSPTEAEWSRLVMTFNHLEKLSNSHLSIDDSDKFVCILGWLGLMDPMFEKSSDKLKGLFKISEGVDQRKIHQLEKLIIYYLKSKQINDKHVVTDYLKILKAHPLYSSPELHFRYFVEDALSDKFSERYENVLLRLRSLTLSKSKSANKIIVDLRNNKIHRPDQIDIVSENMCQAFGLLHKFDSVSDSEFCAIVFGISEFDPIVHNSKLFTILWRMKKTINDQVEFKVKNGRIYSLGNWKNIEIIEIPMILKIMRSSSPDFFQNYSDFQSTHSSHSAEKVHNTTEFLLTINETLSRAEIEKRLGKSRPTCNRMISKWRSLGFLEKEGSGPSTRYRISKNIECRGNNEI